MQTYTGSCACGAVTYEVDSEPITKVMECNCSHCSKKGFLLHFIPREQFRLLSGEDNLTEYRFNRKVIAHLFCKTCGVQGFGYGQRKDGSPTTMVNVRCLNGVDVHALEIQQVNGKDF